MRLNFFSSLSNICFFFSHSSTAPHTPHQGGRHPCFSGTIVIILIRKVKQLAKTVTHSFIGNMYSYIRMKGDRQGQQYQSLPNEFIKHVARVETVAFILEVFQEEN